MQAVADSRDTIAHRVDWLVRRRHLQLRAWYLSDTVETLVWYACRDYTCAERLRITRDAQLAALAGLVRDELDESVYNGLMDALPSHLHGIFMRADPADLQRSW